MFLRFLSTVASLTVGLAAVSVLACTDETFQLPVEDPMGMCPALDTLGTERGLWLAVALALFSFVALVVTWVPGAMPDTLRRRLEPDTSLKHNLDRIASVSTETVGAETAGDVLHAIRLTRRLETIEVAVAADATPSREVTLEWMSLLREANDLHNRDELASEDFKKINTRLLDLFAGPADQAEELAATT